MTDALVSVLLPIGGLFMLLAAVGILRMPDLYMRIGAASKASTLGLVCILTAVAVHFAEIGMSARAVAAVVFILLTTPVAAHVIGRAAYVVGVPLWERTIVDEMRDRQPRRPPADDDSSPSTSSRGSTTRA